MPYLLNSWMYDADGDGKVDVLQRWRDIYTGEEWWIWTFTNNDPAFIYFASNPNPDGDDPGHSGEDYQNMLERMKRIGNGKELSPADFFKTPFGKELLLRGMGIVPAWNPPDIVMENPMDGGGGGAGGYMPNGGSLQQQLKQQASRGGNKQGGKSDGDGDSDREGREQGVFDDDMPGPPPLVNPATRGK